MLCHYAPRDQCSLRCGSRATDHLPRTSGLASTMDAPLAPSTGSDPLLLRAGRCGLGDHDIRESEHVGHGVLWRVHGIARVSSRWSGHQPGREEGQGVIRQHVPAALWLLGCGIVDIAARVLGG